MPKSITSISIDPELIERYKDKRTNVSFSEYVEGLVRKNLGEVVSLSDLENKIKETYENYLYLMDRREEVIKHNEMEIESLKEHEKIEIDRMKNQRQANINQWVEKTKDITEIADMVKEIQSDKNKLLDTKYMLGQVDVLRKKYPSLKVGMFQLRDILARLISSSDPPSV